MLLDTDNTTLIEYWQAGSTAWKSRVRRAGQRHLFQESMVLEAQQCHQKIFMLLRDHAFTFQPDPFDFHFQYRHNPCPDCHRVFSTPQGVHLHRQKIHGVHSPEHHLLDSATCPACMKYLWSTQRLQQHLAYTKPVLCVSSEDWLLSVLLCIGDSACYGRPIQIGRFGCCRPGPGIPNVNENLRLFAPNVWTRG